MIDNALYIWTVYNRPADFPDHVVVRCWRVTGDGAPEVSPTAALYPDLDAMRADMDRLGLHWMPRQVDDDPVIVGVYM